MHRGRECARSEKRPAAARKNDLRGPVNDNVILALNAGSSSIKFALFDPRSLDRAASGAIGSIGTAACALRFEQGGEVEQRELGDRDYEALFGIISDAILNHLDAGRIAACSHRVVHGGQKFATPVLVTGPVLAELEALVELAPLHQPANLSGIHAMAAALPEASQIACFDTAFHRGHPDIADIFAVPRWMTAEGIRRYGFHGLSYEYIAARLENDWPDLSRGRVVVAHLGSGASVCALRAGRSVESSMGFTALDGVPMSTRTGQIDPGVIFHLARGGHDLAEIERLFYKESGLLGISGISSDVRDLLASGAPGARLAIDYFCHRVAREIAAMAVGAGGLDGIVFTAGVGEHQPEIRRLICEQLGFLGVDLDPDANTAGADCLSRPSSAVQVLRLSTDEELMLVRHARNIINNR